MKIQIVNMFLQRERERKMRMGRESREKRGRK